MKVDRKVTIALIFAVFMQTAGALMWMGAAAERLDVLERDVEAQRGVPERLARLEAEISVIRNQLDRIEGKVERL